MPEALPDGAEAAFETGSGSERVDRAVKAALAQYFDVETHAAVALSGGRDSMALLHAVAAFSGARTGALSAIHIHHGLSRHADGWADFCDAACRARSISLTVRRVEVPRGGRTSLEAEARRVRYVALAEAAAAIGARVVLLAHHMDDQSETLLLQLLRGAGPAGLAAMPEMREDAAGLVWLRPLLGVRRMDIDAYARENGLAWIEDDSNADGRHARNALRRSVTPELRAIAHGYPATVARSARLQAESVLLASDLAAIDAAESYDGTSLDCMALSALAPHRARNLLRWFLRERGLPGPSAARLDAMARQLSGTRADAQVRIAHGGAEIGVHRGRVVVHSVPPAPFEHTWHGETSIAFGHGTLSLVSAMGAGIARRRLDVACVTIRSRRGGETLALARNRPRQSLKALLQRAAVPAWSRQALPLVFCDADLAAVPGIGIDYRYRAEPGVEGVEIEWRDG